MQVWRWRQRIIAPIRHTLATTTFSEGGMAPYAFLGQENEIPVAIPDALFKIVIKEGENPSRPDVLAFIYPQVGAGYYRGKPFDHSRYMTTVDEIEKITGIDFLSALPSTSEGMIEKTEVRTLWPVNKKDFIRACQSKFNE